VVSQPPRSAKDEWPQPEPRPSEAPIRDQLADGDADGEEDGELGEQEAEGEQSAGENIGPTFTRVEGQERADTEGDRQREAEIHPLKLVLPTGAGEGERDYEGQGR
jgi:hypothetical protein